MFRAIAVILAVAFLAAACGGAESEPRLTSERPDPPAPSGADPAGEPAVEPSTTTAVPLSETTEPTIVVTAPPVTDEFGVEIPPDQLPDVPLPDEMIDPSLTVLDPEALPPPPPPLAPPAAAPAWQPVTVLVANEDFRGIIPVYDTPNGTRLAFPDGDVWSFTYRRNPLVARVLQGSEGDEWVEVELPVRPNGASGWIRTENFRWSTVSHHILIDVSDRSVILYEGDTVVAATRAIVGKPVTPTPTLSGFIVEKLPNHDYVEYSEVLGDWILMLSFFSEVMDSFDGGLPRIALHGTHIPGRVGETLSNGCIRIPNDIIETIAQRAPLGTVVNIVA